MLCPRPSRPKPLGIALAALLGLSACSAAPVPAPAVKEGAAPQRLGLMTSLPLYWPLGAGLDAIALGRAPIPWQRAALSRDYLVEPLDTLSSIPGLAPDAPATDPLAGLERLVVIQPRGLSPADNVALDNWVRGGGRLLFVLDPMLTGEYDLPFGDPRRPVDMALIPPVVARWGLAVRFDETQQPGVTTVRLGDAPLPLPLALAGQVAIPDPAAADCTLLADGVVARCRVGAGQVMLIADAALFEHAELAGEGGAGVRAVLAAAFE